MNQWKTGVDTCRISVFFLHEIDILWKKVDTRSSSEMSLNSLQLKVCLCVQGSSNQRASVMQAMFAWPVPTRPHPWMGCRAMNVCPVITARKDLPRESNAHKERLAIVSGSRMWQNVATAPPESTARPTVRKGRSWLDGVLFARGILS